jgi:hypothetical protein
MIVRMHLCMPEGDAIRSRFGEILEVVKRDNKTVIAAMLYEGIDVPDTVGELGLVYVPEQHRLDASGHPVLDVYGMRDMIARGTFSCGCAAAYEAAVIEEKYGVPTQCLSVAQGDDDFHGIFVTADSVVDPTANYLQHRRTPIPNVRDMVAGQACWIEDGRVICDEEDRCCVDERGVWTCPAVPGLTG